MIYFTNQINFFIYDVLLAVIVKLKGELYNLSCRHFHILRHTSKKLRIFDVLMLHSTLRLCVKLKHRC